MIRAHMATFPARSGIMMQTVRSILPQVDHLFVCLNQHDAIPPELKAEPKIEAMIPEDDLKDAGKFAFDPAPDDIVLTIDDDILYPPDYVAHTLAHFARLDPRASVLGYLGNAWVARGRAGGMGWKNFMFHKRASNLVKVDVVGTGTTCQLGCNMPRLDVMAEAAGFVDLRHARFHAEAGRWLWIAPREEGWMTSTMTGDLMETSLFHLVNRARSPFMQDELTRLFERRTPHSGLHFGKLRARGLLARGE